MKSYRIYCKHDDAPDMGLVKIGEIRCTPAGGMYLTLNFNPEVEYQLLPDKGPQQRLIVFAKRPYMHEGKRRYRWYTAGSITIHEGEKRLRLNHIPYAVYVVVKSRKMEGDDVIVQALE